MATEISKYNKRLEALKSERSSFIPLWRELSDNHLAHRGRFLTSDRNKGYKRNTSQYNNTSRMASRTLASGLMAGITSPARPWFRLGAPDPEMNEYAPVKSWLHTVQTIMYKVYAKSNTYNSLHQLYSELGVFGTGVMGMYDNFENVTHCKPYTVGSYMLAMNGENVVDTFYREYEYTVAQLVKQFGIENCSEAVNGQWRSGNTEAWVKIVHLIEPNDDRDNMSPLAKDMRFRSVYYEQGAETRNSNKLLRESGFNSFPIMAPRWDVTGEDIYATDCPGITALGDTKALQLGEMRKYQAIDILVKPPLQGPASLRNKIGTSVRPGDIITTDSNGVGLKSIYDFRPDLNAMMAINHESEGRIKRAFYEDLFLMIANDTRSNVTAREISEKHEEKLLMLGPVLERLHTELLDPVIDNTFDKLQRAGVLPPPPPELEGADLRVDYVSVLAQAQRMVGVGAIDRLLGYTAQVAQLNPSSVNKIDFDQSIDEYGDALGVSPKIVRSDDAVAAINQQQAEQAAKEQAAAQGQQMADTAKTMADTPMGDENALSTMLRGAGLQ